MKRSPTQWFKCWKNIILHDKAITRMDLSLRSGASLWIIKGLQKDFLDGEAYIRYEDGKFKALDVNSLTISLSNLSEKDKERLK